MTLAVVKLYLQWYLWASVNIRPLLQPFEKKYLSIIQITEFIIRNCWLNLSYPCDACVGKLGQPLILEDSSLLLITILSHHNMVIVLFSIIITIDTTKLTHEHENHLLCCISTSTPCRVLNWHTFYKEYYVYLFVYDLWDAVQHGRSVTSFRANFPPCLSISAYSKIQNWSYLVLL